MYFSSAAFYCYVSLKNMLELIQNTCEHNVTYKEQSNMYCFKDSRKFRNP